MSTGRLKAQIGLGCLYHPIWGFFYTTTIPTVVHRRYPSHKIAPSEDQNFADFVFSNPPPHRDAQSRQTNTHSRHTNNVQTKQARYPDGC